MLANPIQKRSSLSFSFWNPIRSILFLITRYKKDNRKKKLEFTQPFSGLLKRKWKNLIVKAGFYEIHTIHKKDKRPEGQVFLPPSDGFSQISSKNCKKLHLFSTANFGNCVIKPVWLSLQDKTGWKNSWFLHKFRETLQQPLPRVHS